MSDYYIWVLAAAVIGFMVWRMMRNRISADEARALIGAGAVVLDVRSSAEFASGKVPGVRNLPLDEIGLRIGKMVPDKSTAVLCHCASGARSGSAAAHLRSMGYAQAFNLGSFQRAAAIMKK